MNRRRRRTNIYLALITILFFLSWTPLVLYSVLFDFFRHFLPERHSMASVGYAFSLLFGLTTPMANPILYTSLNESFRTTLAAKWWWCCGRKLLAGKRDAEAQASWLR